MRVDQQNYRAQLGKVAKFYVNEGGRGRALTCPQPSRVGRRAGDARPQIVFGEVYIRVPRFYIIKRSPGLHG